MKLSISNIAWGNRLDPTILSFIRASGCKGIELAPGLLNEHDISGKKIKETRKMIEDSGLELVGFHALLFEYKDLALCDRACWKTLMDVIKIRSALCKALGGSLLVFGSPTSRRIPIGMTRDDCMMLLEECFEKMSVIAGEDENILLIEPLPVAEMIRDHNDGIAIVKTVAHPNFKLHCDTRTLAENNSPIEAFFDMAPLLSHVHTGGKNLSFISENDGIDHNAYGKALNEIHYQGFITLEMRHRRNCIDHVAIATSVKYALDKYEIHP